MKLRERFEVIMGFQKTDLTSSTTSEEKVSTEIIEIEENKCDKVESTEILPVIADSGEVCINLMQVNYDNLQFLNNSSNFE